MNGTEPWRLLTESVGSLKKVAEGYVSDPVGSCSACGSVIHLKQNKTGLCKKCWHKEYYREHKDSISAQGKVHRESKKKPKIIYMIPCVTCGDIFEVRGNNKLGLCPRCMRKRSNEHTKELARIKRDSNPKKPRGGWKHATKLLVCTLCGEEYVAVRGDFCPTCRRVRERQSEDPIKKKERRRRARAKRLRAEGVLDFGQDLVLARESDYTCVYCGTRVEHDYQLDHIVPLAKGGSNWISNYQILCQTCNVTKAAQLPWVYEAEIGFQRDPEFWWDHALYTTPGCLLIGVTELGQLG